MTKYLIPTLLLILICSKSYTQTTAKACSKCDIPVVNEVDRNLKKLTDSQLYLFLCGLDKSCSLNIEYSEYSNEVLFNVLLNYPDRVIDILHRNAGLDINYIYDELSSPVIASDLDATIKKVEGGHGDEKIKQNILKCLRIAKAKY